MMASREDFIQRCGSSKCFVDTIFQQCPHTEQAGLTANFLVGSAVEGHFADAGIHLEQFEDAKPAAVASPCVSAVCAACSTGAVVSAARAVARNVTDASGCEL